jgi:peptide/nickel transport system substrate-binding protein
MVRNPDYWDPNFLPNIEEFTWRVIKDSASVVASLQTGEIDMCGIPFQQAAAIEQDPALRLDAYDTTSFNWYNMMQDPSRTTLFVDPKVRQALQYGLDRDLIAETIYLGYAIRADGTQPVLSIAYAPNRINTIYNHDPEKAKALLAEAGWTDADGDGFVEKDGVKMSFECHFSEGTAIYEQQIPYMQQAWREIGVEMIPSAIPFPTLSEMGDTGNYQMRVYGFTWGVDGSQGTMFRCNSVPPAGFNTMHYCNEEYDRLDALQQAELDVDKRIDLLIEQSNIVNDEVAAGIIVFRKSAAGSLRKVHNYFPNGYGALRSLPFVWKEA